MSESIVITIRTFIEENNKVYKHGNWGHYRKNLIKTLAMTTPCKT